MKHDKHDRAVTPYVPPAGPMFTPRLLLGYTGITTLAVGLPGAFGCFAAAATKFGLDAFIDGIGFGLGASLIALSTVLVSLRGGRKPLILRPIGYTLLFIYVIAVIVFAALNISPKMVVNKEMMIIADVGAAALLLLSPFTIFIWRMARDPALH